MQKEIAVITGATSGIGAAYARYFARQGYDLVLTGHPNDAIDPCLNELESKYGIKMQLIYADFSNKLDIACVENAIKQHEISVLVNNAGFGLGKPFWQDDIQTLENMITVHTIAPVRFIYAALPAMISRKKGIIINLSSLSSFIPIPLDSLYSATKIFHNSFMESLHIALRDKGIKVQALCPGIVETNFHKQQVSDKQLMQKKRILPWMQPDRVVEISIKNLHNKSKVIVIPGFRNRLIRTLYNIVPRWLYYKIAAKYLL